MMVERHGRDALPIIAFIIPCYNEEAALEHTLATMIRLLDGLSASGRISSNSYLFLVDDGSADGTWALIEQTCRAQPKKVRGMKLARNVGQQIALFAGITAQLGKADATISLDADLQDDISAIEQMISRFVEDNVEIVFAVRQSRDADTMFKRSSARWYYRILRWLGTDVIPNHADFRLMGNRAMRALAEFGEVHLFLRGLVTQLGFRTGIVTFDRLPRQEGETKYSMAKMASLAADGITSFSVRPLRLVFGLGLLLLLVSAIAIVWVFMAWLLGATIEGWASLMLFFLVVSSFHTLALGVLGEYVGKIYFETKSRPRYIVEEEISK